jgi:hypothetical protein
VFLFCQITWLLVDMTFAFIEHHVVERQSPPCARKCRTWFERIPNERFIAGSIALWQTTRTKICEPGILLAFHDQAPLVSGRAHGPTVSEA